MPPVTIDQPAHRPVVGRRYREIRSARFPQGFPDRSDPTVIEAFDSGWLLIEHFPGKADLVGMAEDYETARAWLTEGADTDADADADAGAGADEA